MEGAMEAIQTLVSEKVQELLTLCGVGNSRDDEIKQCITQLSNYVHKSRVDAGINDPPCPPRQLRGSYRILKNSEKGGRKDFKGLTARDKKKRRKARNISKSTNDGNSGPPSQDNDTANRGSSDIPHCTGTGPNLASKIGDEVIDAVKTPQNNGAQLRASCSGVSEEEASTALIAPLWQQDPAGTTRVITTILLDCIKLNFVIGKHGRETKHMFTTTKTKEIRKWIEHISQLDYATAVTMLKKENAFFAGQDVLKRYHDTAIWAIIMKGAELLDKTRLPTSKGPLDDFSMAEKVATKLFMEDVGYGTSLQNQRLWRNLWKNLFQMRQAGVERILFYRTKEFDTYCKEYPKKGHIPLIDMVLSWESTFGPQIEQLENRAFKWSQGDFTGRVYLDDEHVAQRLEVEHTSWNNATNEWLSLDEESAAQLAGVQRDIPGQLWSPYDNNNISEHSTNKSIFISLMPADDERLTVRPIVPVREGDFLGIFSGKIRFSGKFDPVHGIRGPSKDLWLDYSRTTGVLNQMRVLQTGGNVNVRLQWELIHEEDEIQSKVSWRVSVRALRAIAPFQELVREAPQKEQYLLHRSPVYAKRGFLKSCVR